MCPTVTTHEEETINISFKLTPEEHSLLISISDEDDRSMAGMLRKLIKIRAKERGFIKENQK